jgi:hypothetical protein
MSAAPGTRGGVRLRAVAARVCGRGGSAFCTAGYGGFAKSATSVGAQGI